MNDLNNSTYIKVCRDLDFEDSKLRVTILKQGCIGYLIEKSEDIETVWGISPDQVKRALRMFDSSRAGGNFLCLIAGYFCILKEKDFIRCKKPTGLLQPAWEIF